MDLKTLRDTPPWDWPDDAGGMLLEVLRNPLAAAADRLLAVELAGDLTVIDDEMAAQLVTVMRDPAESEDLRGEAAIALGPVLEYSDEEGFEGDDLPISEGTFQAIQESLRALFLDTEVPKEVRRRVLEASVRAPQPWHAGAVRDAWASGDGEWTLTAVFCMQYVRGFEAQILEALESGSAEVRHEAVCAAGAWAVEAAWPTVAPFLSLKTPKPLLLAAIEAAVFVCPEDAPRLLQPLLASRDEDVVEAVHEALEMVEDLPEDEEEEEHKGTWH
jgi:HEAT repeat protein